MKKNLLFFSVVITFLLAGCFETTDEITLKKDGSGVMTSTNDMSMLISMAKGMGGADAIGDDKATDTIVSLAKMADSLTSLTDEEKDLVRNGKLGLNINMADEKMITRLEIPFTKPEQVDKIKGIASKITNYFLGKNMGDNMPPGLGDKMPSSDPVGDYYILTYATGVIERKLNKEKYAGLESDEIMKGVKEMADNGMPMSNTMVINLPSPVKSVTGKSVTLSEDKMKVTIKSPVESFFDDAAGLEFRIEY